MTLRKATGIGFMLTLLGSLLVWSTWVVVQLQIGRSTLQSLSDRMEAVDDLRSRSLLNLTRSAPQLLDTWDLRALRWRQEVAEKDYWASREALDVILRQNDATAPQLASVDEDVRHMIRHARSAFALAAAREQLLSAGASPGGLHAEERAAAQAVAQMEQSYVQAHDGIHRWEGELRARHNSLYAVRLRLFNQLYLVVVFTAALACWGLWLDRRNFQQRQALRKILALQHAILAGTNRAIVSTDLNGIITSFNQGAERMFGYSAAEMIGKATPFLLHDRVEFEEEMTKRASELSAETQGEVTSGFEAFVARTRKGIPDERRWTFVRKDGSRFPAILSLTSLRDPDGRETGYLGIASDISVQVAAEAQLRLQSTALEAAANAIVIADRTGTITWVNPAFGQLTGYSLEQVIGQNPRLLKSGNHPKEFYIQLWEHILSGKVWKGEIQNRRADGQIYLEEMTITPVCNTKGEISHFIAIKQDITVRKRAQAEMEQARAAAEEATRLKSEFLANMSHEIRTPMNGVIGMTEILLETRLDSHQREYAESVRDSAESLLALLNDILDLSKIEAGKLGLESVDFRLRDVIEGALDLFASRVSLKQLELLAELDPQLPDVVQGDPNRLRQVLINLLGNAIKFTERGEVGLKVSMREEREDGCTVLFESWDTGIGIPPEKQSSIFEKFTQADGSTTRQYGGTGLGLAIASQLVQMMGGNIALQSEVGVGSRFSFAISLRKGTSPSAGEQTARLSGLRILVVDDNATTRRILEQLLHAKGALVSLAEEAGSALEQLGRAAQAGSPFDLALIDGQMPRMDGMMLAQGIRSDPQFHGLRMILLTSMGTANVRQAEAAGFSATLLKPIRQSQLLATIEEVMRGTTSSKHEAKAVAGHHIALARLTKSAHVLIAEDHEVNRAVATAALQGMGFEVACVVNGKQAVEAVSTGAYDLVLMDVQMPEMDGFQATAAIRAMESGNSRIPIIALTANAMKGDRERCLQAGMDDYLPKPLRPMHLRALVEKWIGSESQSPARAHLPEAKEGPESAIDWAALRASASGDCDLVKELVELFLADLENVWPEIEAAVHSGDAAELESRAHRLKGASLTIGALALGKLLFELEKMGRQKRVVESAQLLEDARLARDAVRASLAAFPVETGLLPRERCGQHQTLLSG